MAFALGSKKERSLDIELTCFELTYKKASHSQSVASFVEATCAK